MSRVASAAEALTGAVSSRSRVVEKVAEGKE